MNQSVLYSVFHTLNFFLSCAMYVFWCSEKF